MLNTLKTTMLLGALTGMLLLFGAALGGRSGMAAMLLVSIVLNLGTWFFSDWIVIRTTGAVPVPPGQLDWLQREIEDLSRRAGIPTPRLYLLPHEPSPNAFATGRSPSKGVVAVTAGLLNTLDRREIRGVLAHELGHIKNRDTLVSAVAATIAGVITFLARMALWTGGGRDRNVNPLVMIGLAVLAPIAAVLVRMAISRTREYGADARAARITGDPEGLARALERLQSGVRRAPMQTEGAEQIHFFVNGFAGGLGRLFSTHPPIEKRAARLRAMQIRRPAGG